LSGDGNECLKCKPLPVSLWGAGAVPVECLRQWSTSGVPVECLRGVPVLAVDARECGAGRRRRLNARKAPHTPRTSEREDTHGMVQQRKASTCFTIYYLLFTESDSVVRALMAAGAEAQAV
jgi:hypothetical protein